jgi:type II secretory pathway pseudopilin PulG
MTIVEVVVAAVLLVMAATATLSMVDTSTRTSFKAEERQTVINVAQREIEQLRDLSFQQLAMTSVPAATTDANLPTSRIRTGSSFCLERVDGDDPCTAPPLVANGGQLENGGGTIAGGTVQPFTNDVQVGDMTMDIYRFVVWQDEGDELLSPTSEFCQDKPLHYRCKAQDYKRIVVAVRTEEAPISHERPYEEVQSDFIDPDRATLDAEPLGPGEGNVVTGQQFYLSDTRCQTGSTEPTRGPFTNHETHDTLGTCSSGSQAPNALLTSPPNDPDPADQSNPGFFDYSTEIEPGNCGSVNCDTSDSGLQMLDQASTCVPAPSGTDARRQIHRWVSTPMPVGFQFESTDRSTLELWTRTINGVQGASGTVCGFFFKRSTAGVDTILATDSHTTSNWPSGPAWDKVRLHFDLDTLSQVQRTILAGERLGVSIGVDPSGTPDNVLQFLYDHPEGASRLEVLTTTPLPAL